MRGLAQQREHAGVDLGGVVGAPPRAEDAEPRAVLGVAVLHDLDGDRVVAEDGVHLDVDGVAGEGFREDVQAGRVRVGVERRCVAGGDEGGFGVERQLHLHAVERRGRRVHQAQARVAVVGRADDADQVAPALEEDRVPRERHAARSHGVRDGQRLGAEVREPRGRPEAAADQREGHVDVVLAREVELALEQGQVEDARRRLEVGPGDAHEDAVDEGQLGDRGEHRVRVRVGRRAAAVDAGGGREELERVGHAPALVVERGGGGLGGGRQGDERQGEEGMEAEHGGAGV